MRDAFASEVTALAEADPRVVLLSGDIGNRMFDRFKERCPGRFLNCGVAEANMTSLAAGLALCGMRPVTYTIAAFNTARCLEQIRVDLCYQGLPVVVAGTGAGLSYASLGGTHHCCEDLASMRTLPGMTVLAPADANEVRAALRAAMRHNGPVYLRLGKKGEPVVHDAVPPFEIGRGRVLRQGTGACLLATGTVVAVALDAARAMAARGLEPGVVSLPSVKPLDFALLEDVAARYAVFATVEEHSVVGGLGGAVAEWLAERDGARPRLVRIGTQDVFLHGAGTQEEARARCGIEAGAIAERVLAAAAAGGGRADRR